jgi:hypothetical protein
MIYLLGRIDAVYCTSLQRATAQLDIHRRHARPSQRQVRKPLLVVGDVGDEPIWRLRQKGLRSACDLKIEDLAAAINGERSHHRGGRIARRCSRHRALGRYPPARQSGAPIVESRA